MLSYTVIKNVGHNCWNVWKDTKTLVAVFCEDFKNEYAVPHRISFSSMGGLSDLTEAECDELETKWRALKNYVQNGLVGDTELILVGFDGCESVLGDGNVHESEAWKECIASLGISTSPVPADVIAELADNEEDISSYFTNKGVMICANHAPST